VGKEQGTCCPFDGDGLPRREARGVEKKRMKKKNQEKETEKKRRREG